MKNYFAQKRLRLLSIIILGWLGTFLLWLGVFSHAASSFEHPANLPINPFLNVFPDPTGRELYVSIYGVDSPVDTLFVNAKIGPTGHEYSYTASYSNTQGIYAATVVGFTPGQDTVATLNLTSTTGLNTPDQTYPRFFIPAGIPRSVQVDNGTLALSIVNTDTFANETYLAVAPGFTPGSVVPDSYRVLGQPYTINASGSITASLRPMLLKFHYSPVDLQGAAPDTLAIMQWQPATQQWLRLPSRVFPARNELVTTISRFTTYALMVTPTWRDDFDDLAGLDLATLQNVDLRLKAGFADLLALTGSATTGLAVSKIITPPVGIHQWDTVTYSASSNPPTTTLRIDLLDRNGARLATNLMNGASLHTIDPLAHPALRLRAVFTTTIPSQSALLDEWVLSWQHPIVMPTATPTATPTAISTAIPYFIYLPEVAR